MGLSLGDYVVTEAGFGGDLGAEKFMDILKVLYIVRLICILFMIETILIPFYTFEYNRIDMHNF